MPNTQNNTTPNSNNLFDIFKAQVESISALNEVIVKAKINKKVGQRIEEASQVAISATKVVFNALNDISKQNLSQLQQVSKVMDSVFGSLGKVFEVIDSLAKMKFGSVLVAKVRIFRLRIITADLMDLLWRVGLVNPAVFVSGEAVLLLMNKGIGTIIDLIIKLKKIPFIFIAHKRIKKLYKLIFGHGRGEPRKPGDVGLYDIYKRLAKEKILANIKKGSIAILWMAIALKQITGALSLLGLALPLVVASWFAVKLLNPITKQLSRIFRRLGHKTKTIIKGGFALAFMAAALSFFIASLVLVGIVVAKGYKLIGVALLVIVAIVGMFILLGMIKKFIRRGFKTIRYITLAMVMLGLVAITMALIGMYVTANLKSFEIFALYMLVLVGVFLLLALATKLIKKGAKNLLIIVICVAILALIAMVMALVGQYIMANWEAMAVMVLALAALVAAVVMIGIFHKKIEKGAVAMVLIIAFSLAMVIVMGAIAAIAALGDPLKMLEVSGIMLLIIVGVGACAFVAGKLQTEILQGLPAMIVIGIIAGLMSVVMIGIAAAAAIADPLDMLAVVGIMTLIIIAIGALAIGAGLLLAGPQAAIFALGIVALGMIAAICAAIAGVAILIAAAAKAIDSIGFSDPTEVATILNLPFAALVRGDKNGESLFDILKDLPNVITLGKLVLKIGALSLIMCEVGLIANVLQHIASLNMPDPEAGYDDKGKPKGWKQMQADDFAKAATNTSVILGMTAAMFGDEEKEFTLGDGSKFKVQVINLEAIDKIGYMTKIKVQRLSKIVGCVGDMADTLQHIASLNMPDPEAGYTEDGRPKGWKQMKGPDFAEAATNAATILSFFADLFADKPVTRQIKGQTVVIGMTNELEGLDNISRSMRRKVERLGDIIQVVGGMATTLQNISSLNMPDPEAGYTEDGRPKNWIPMGKTAFEDASENAKKIITTLVGAVSSDDLAERLDNMSRKASDNFQKIMSPMGQISGMVELVQSLASGEYVKTWKDDPDHPGQRIPDQYGKYSELLNQSDKITQNLTALFGIVICSIALFDTLFKDQREQAVAAIDDVAKIVSGIKGPIEDMISIYNNGLADLDAEQMEKKYTIISGNIKRIVSDIAGNKDTKKDIAVQIEKNLKQTTEMFKTIGGVDLEKLKKAADLMGNIARLSESIHGNFEGLARVINEQLLTALDAFRTELNDLNTNGITVTQRVVNEGNQVGNTIQSGDKKSDKTGTINRNGDTKQESKKEDSYAQKIYKLLTGTDGTNKAQVHTIP